MRVWSKAVLPLSVAFLITLSLSTITHGADANEQNRAQIEEIMRDYILSHPEVIIESLQRGELAKRKAAEEKAAAALKTHRDKIENGPLTPVAGNAEGDVTVVEFFDYRCPYCKRVVPAIQELLQTDPNVRYVFQEFPILGDESLTASKAALAVWKTAPEKYLDFHVALMQARGSLTEERVLKIAESADLNPEQLRAAMNDDAITAQLDRNRQLGQIIGITGTPAFIVGDQIIPGAVDLETLKKLIASARSS